MFQIVRLYAFTHKKKCKKTFQVYYFTIIIFILYLLENYLKDVTKSRK